MKRFNFSFLAVLVAIFILSGCSGLNKMKKNASGINFKTTPEVVDTGIEFPSGPPLELEVG